MSESRRDYYALLGIGADADGGAVRAAYLALAKRLHPDMADDDQAALRSTERFVLIQEAYDVLRDPTRRRQYDEERGRLSASEKAERAQREAAYREALIQRAAPITSRVSAMVKPIFSSPQTSSGFSFWLYSGAMVLAVVAVGMIVSHQNSERDKQNQVLIVKVDPQRTAPPRAEARPAEAPPDISAISKEMERNSRAQVARVEAAKKRVEAEIEAALKAKSEPKPPPAPVERSAKVDCTGEGRAFSLVHEQGTISISYNGGPAMRPTVADPGTGVIIVSKVEPSNRISIGFMKGDKNGTIVMIADEKGKVLRTVGVDCTGVAF